MNDTLLIATVGGTPEPLVASELRWRPSRTIFVVSPETRNTVAGDIVPKLRESGWPEFDAGRYDLHEITDSQDYSRIVNELRPLESQVETWRRDHSSSEVIADITAGTKAMSAALALIAGRFSCRISYVGGKERTKNGVGIVVSGKEQFIHADNPADALGLVALDTALELIRNHAFGAAHATLLRALRRVTDPARKDELHSLASFAEALAEWDRFQHNKALNLLNKLPRHQHNLKAAVGLVAARNILESSAKLQRHLGALVDADVRRPSRELILDLLANARRRMDDQRWDDATARLYRAIEATAQFYLAGHGIPETGKVPFDRLPESLRTKFSPPSSGTVKLGLQDAWELLRSLSPDTAQPFFSAGLASKGDGNNHSPLQERNSSILAHGFSPVSSTVAEKLFAAALKIVKANVDELPNIVI